MFKYKGIEKKFLNVRKPWNFKPKGKCLNNKKKKTLIAKTYLTQWKSSVNQEINTVMIKSQCAVNQPQ